MPAQERLQAARRAAALYITHPFFLQHQHIACYMAVTPECATTHFIHHIWQAHKTCYLPVLTADRQLQFAVYQQGDALQRNRYGILEPKASCRLIAPQLLDSVLLPLVAFDQAGYRLGRGGGYYDATFAFLQHARAASSRRKCYLIGLAYAKQQWPTLLPRDTWDISLDAVLTEKEWHFFA